LEELLDQELRMLQRGSTKPSTVTVGLAVFVGTGDFEAARNRSDVDHRRAIELLREFLTALPCSLQPLTYAFNKAYGGDAGKEEDVQSSHRRRKLFILTSRRHLCIQASLELLKNVS